MKKTILLFSLLTLVACTPPMKSEPNKCKCTPGHCCADTVKECLTPIQKTPTQEDVVLEENLPTHVYEEIPHMDDEIL